jgi:hypothetical protein
MTLIIIIIIIIILIFLNFKFFSEGGSQLLTQTWKILLTPKYIGQLAQQAQQNLDL